MTRSTLLRLFFFACILAVLVLALVPKPPETLTTGWDKSNHVLAFFVLTIVGSHAYPKNVVLLLSGLLAFGGLIELLQAWTGSRSGEIADLLADGFGILAACLVMAVVRRCSPPVRSQ